MPSATAWQNWNTASPPWNLPPTPPESLTPLLAGIAAYRRHPATRTLQDPPCLWHEGEIRLLDYGTNQAAPPILFVPSLINRPYILDLSPNRSLLRALAEAGHRPLLLDWGWPTEPERGYTLTDYIAGPLERAIAAVGTPLTLAGYCMGGLLAAAAAQRRPDLIHRLVLLATPWDFRAHNPEGADALAAIIPLLHPILATTNTLPIDILQSLFALLDPQAVARKYRRFATLPQHTEAAENFVALEDWANDGVPLAAPVARECLEHWYGRNAPLLNEWRVAGQPIRPASIPQPAFVAIPATDRIVPPASARPLAAALPNATILEPRAGHVSMVAGTNAATTLWAPLFEWLRHHPTH